MLNYNAMGLENDEEIGASARELSPVEIALNAFPVAGTLLRDILSSEGSQRLITGLDDIFGKMTAYKKMIKKTLEEEPELIEFMDSIGEEVGFDGEKIKDKNSGDISRLIADLKQSIKKGENDQLMALSTQKGVITRGVNVIVQTLWEMPDNFNGNNIKYFYHQTSGQGGLDGICRSKGL